ncbi:MAG: PKD domain-containing protein [Cyclobacteriaceae bacterium]|nr:PKD domain-containing protein [Cyclobacteriaceae bacterium]
MRKIVCILVSTLLIGSVGCAQTRTSAYIDNEYVSNLLPKTPTAAGLGSFGNIPVNYYTGQPELSLPLMTLMGRELSLPVVVNYDASGVKSDDISGQVGLKWNLNAGGYVARDLEGLPDEDPDKGYLKYALLSDYWNTVTSITDWVTNSEKNTHDCHPDDFTIVINGRSIRFMFDKYGKAHTIPRQNIKITYEKLSNKIYKFIVVTEDGTKYEFGGDATAVEERKIERLVTKFGYRYDPSVTLYQNSTRREFFTGFEWLEEDYDQSDEKAAVEFYNSRWYLKKITAAGTDQMTFTYTKGTNTTYSLKPTVVRSRPILVRLGYYKIEETIGGDFERWFIPCYPPPPDWTGTLDYNGLSNHRNLLAIREFQLTDPSSVPDNLPSVDIWDEVRSSPWYVTNPAQSWTNNYNAAGFGGANDLWGSSGVKQSAGNYYLKPETTPPTPGGVNVTNILVTESSIRLTSVIAASGARIDFTWSTRSDLPNAYKLDRVELWNTQNEKVKNIRLNYSTVNVDVTQHNGNDPMWLTEALLMAKLNNHQQSDAIYQAHFGMAYTASDFDASATFEKYVLEGLKDYNYKRLFLMNITDESGTPDRILYEFTYEDPHKLRRRTTPAFNETGFGSDYPRCDGVTPNGQAIDGPRYNITSSKTANTALSFSQDLNTFPAGVQRTRGILTKITYPTKGSTTFVYQNSIGPRLLSVQDKDEQGNTLSEKSIKYLNTSTNGSFRYESFIESKVQGTTNSWVKTWITSTAPQNDRPLHGPLQINLSVRVYNGTELINKGWEDFTFYDASNGHGNEVTMVLAEPIDKNAAGVDLTNGMANIYPFPRQTNRQYARGMVKSHTIFTAAGKMVKKTEYDYDLNPNGYVPIIIQGFTGAKFMADGYGGTSGQQSNRYRYARYKIPIDWVVLAKTIETVYDLDIQTKTATLINQYTYDSDNLQLIETTSHNPVLPTQKQIIKTKYATDAAYNSTLQQQSCAQQYTTCKNGCMSGSETQRVACIQQCELSRGSCTDVPVAGTSPEVGALISLRNRNNVTAPIETQMLVEEDAVRYVTGAQVYLYNEQGSPVTFVKPKEVWGTSQTVPATGFTGGTVTGSGTFQIPPSFRKAHSFDAYNASTGNLMQQTTLDGITSQYTYGYNNSLLTGFTVSPVTNPMSYSFQHKPFVGITSNTDPNGRSSYYEFDSFGRLKITKDHDGNILSRTRYRYKTEQGGLSDYINGPTTYPAGQLAVLTTSDNLTQVTYNWNFGDGSLQGGGTNMVQHKFVSGTYRVTVDKNHSTYGNLTASRIITITNPPGIPLLIVTNSKQNLDLCVDGSVPAQMFASLEGPCSGQPLTWQYRVTGGDPTWITLGTGNMMFSPETMVPVQYEIRCITTTCSESLVSNTLTVKYIRSNPSCPIPVY